MEKNGEEMDPVPLPNFERRGLAIASYCQKPYYRGILFTCVIV
jgi:hypothetical protein